MLHKEKLAGGILFAMWLPIVLIVAAISGGTAQGQTFDSTSDGSDGALDFTGMTGEILFDPTSFNPDLDIDGDNVYHFTTITIPLGLTVKLRAPQLQFAPVYWLASGAVQISGVLDVSGEPGHEPMNNLRSPSIPGPGGFPGGVGATADSAASAGGGPGAGGPDGRGFYATFIPYGNLFLLPLIGGSGGGGRSAPPAGPGGGAGGGAILIASSTSINIGGSILANGGPGPVFAPGGSGGAIRLIAPTISGAGTVQAVGTGCPNCGSGGGEGRVRIETFNNQYTGSILGIFRVVTISPNPIFLPTSDFPKVRVVSVDGVAVPSNPTGSFTIPDTVINKGTPVTFQIAAENIPTGNTVTLQLFSETGANQFVTSTALTGTLGNSTATAMAAVPNGFSRCTVRATWTP